MKFVPNNSNGIVSSQKSINQNNNKKQQAVPTVDLISFDSWDFVGGETGTVATNSITSATTAVTADDCCSLRTVPSIDASDFHASTTKHIRSNNENVEVSVSGVIFSLQPATYKRMQKLPWQTQQQQQQQQQRSGPHDGNNNGILHLHTSPVLFELLLNHIMFGTLPDSSKLSTADIEELEPFILLLDLFQLQKHLLEKKKTLLLRRVSSYRRRISLDRKQKNKGHTTTSNKTIVRKMHSAITNNRRFSSSNDKRKKQHEELCANSDHVN